MSKKQVTDLIIDTAIRAGMTYEPTERGSVVISGTRTSGQGCYRTLLEGALVYLDVATR